MPDYSSDCFLIGAFPLREKCPTIAVTFFSSDYNPHTDRSTFLTILTILKSYNSYLANLNTEAKPCFANTCELLKKPNKQYHTKNQG